MVSRSSSKSRSRSKESLLNFSSRLSLSGGTAVPSRVSWKRLRKQFPWLKQLKPHQVKGAKAASSTNGFALLFAQRTGKTWVTGAVLTAEYGVSLDVLLVGPLTNLTSTWEKFLTDKLPWYSVHRDLISFQKRDKEKHNILLLNPEQVTPLLGKLRRIKWDRMIWDEAQRLKNRTSRSSRDAGLLAGSAKRRLALTGTPMDLDPKDLWAIMRFVDPQVLGTIWKDFEEEYLVKPKIDMNKKMGMIQRQKMMLAYQIAKRKAPMREDMSDHFAERIGPHVLRISREDAGIQSAKIKTVLFDLEEREAKKYRQLEKTMVVKYRGTKIKTPLKIVQIGKLQQLTGGHIKDEEGNVHRTGFSKKRQMRQLIRDNVGNKPFVLFCKFVWEVDMLYKMIDSMDLGVGAKLWGKVKDLKRDKRRTNMLLDFQAGKLDWMVCQQRTGGVGVDLYRARKFFVYSMGHSFIDFDQMVSRGDFLEQKEQATFFLPAVRSSIDTDIITSVTRKKSITELFYDRLKRAT